jgi:hypothetical protein
MPNREHDTEPSHQSPVNPKIYPLLIEEEEARTNLTNLIDTTLAMPDQSVVGGTQEILLAFESYMHGVKELTDLIKLGHA